jgi:hypothetical protein
MRDGSGASASEPAANPKLLRWAVRLLVVETGLLAALVLALVVADVTAQAASGRAAVAVTLYVAIIAALLGFLTRSLARHRAWARGPAVVLNMLLLPIGFTMTAGGLAWVGVPLMLLGLVGAGLLLAPGTRAALLTQ